MATVAAIPWITPETAVAACLVIVLDGRFGRRQDEVNYDYVGLAYVEPTLTTVRGDYYPNAIIHQILHKAIIQYFPVSSIKSIQQSGHHL